MKISLVPYAGLCNRMNAIVCAIQAHKTYDVPINIYWEKTNDCCAEFSDLFQPLMNTDIKVQPIKHFYLKYGGPKKLYIPNLVRHLYFDKSIKGDLISNSCLNEVFKNSDNVYINSANRFCNLDGIDLIYGDFFQPSTVIKLKIETLTKTFSSNTIGIHIRRTDNEVAIRTNPLENYITLMKKEIEKDFDTTFYIASDSEEVKSFFKKIFGDRIIEEQLCLTRKSVRGMQDAVSELYCLSETKKIIGSSNSTYSLIASRIRKIPLVLASEL